MSEDCKRCYQTMLIRDGEEPTEVCDHCAHEMLSEIADVVLAYRPKSRQPKPHKRKKRKHACSDAWHKEKGPNAALVCCPSCGHSSA
jgi:DNA-directed RNA polymerase subunit M/transcription elongation factor TFIIS